jgi:hypothetical protein
LLVRGEQKIVQDVIIYGELKFQRLPKVINLYFFSSFMKLAPSSHSGAIFCPINNKHVSQFLMMTPITETYLKYVK